MKFLNETIDEIGPILERPSVQNMVLTWLSRMKAADDSSLRTVVNEAIAALWKPLESTDARNTLLLWLNKARAVASHGISDVEIERVYHEAGAQQDLDELLWIFRAVEAIKPHTIVEIGVNHGGSLRVWRLLLDKPDDLLIAMDPDPDRILKWNYREDPVVREIQDFSYGPGVVDRVRDILQGRPIDFLWIDGDHAESGVRKDFEIYNPLVRTGGIIGFHDLTDDGTGVGGVTAFWRDIDTRYGVKKHEYFSPLHDSHGYGTGYVLKV